MSVDLLDPSQTFYCGCHRQYPIHWNNTINSELKKLIETGIIQKYDKKASPRYLSSTHWVEKKCKVG